MKSRKDQAILAKDFWFGKVKGDPAKSLMKTFASRVTYYLFYSIVYGKMQEAQR
jgi:hypothetical protein